MPAKADIELQATVLKKSLSPAQSKQSNLSASLLSFMNASQFVYGRVLGEQWTVIRQTPPAGRGQQDVNVLSASASPTLQRYIVIYIGTMTKN